MIDGFLYAVAALGALLLFAPSPGHHPATRSAAGLAGPRWFLLPPRRGPVARGDVQHGVSALNHWLNVMHLTPPRALCGAMLIIPDEEAPASPDGSVIALPPCPACAAHAPWMSAGQVQR